MPNSHQWRCRYTALWRLALVPVVMIVMLVPTSAASQTPTAIAQIRYEEGVRLYESDEFDEALLAFRDSMETVASPNSRLYVARCLRELGRNAEAIGVYRVAARSAADRSAHDRRYSETQQAAERERQALLPLVGWITVAHEGDPPRSLTLTIAGRDVPLQALNIPLPIDPGEAFVRAQSEGYHDFEQEFTVAAEERLTLHLRLELIPLTEETRAEQREETQQRQSRRRGLIAATFASLGAAIVSAIACAVLVSLANDLHGELIRECDGGPCPPERQIDIDRGQSLELWSNVTLGIGIGMGALSAVFALITPWRSLDTTTGPESRLSENRGAFGLVDTALLMRHSRAWEHR